jgi:hypothetical protein
MMCRSVFLLLLSVSAGASRSRQGATGGVVKQGTQLGLRLPADIVFTERSASLAEVRVEQGVPAPEDGKDMRVMLSVAEQDNSLRLHLNGKPEDVPKGYVPVAWANYRNTVAQNGWGYLSVNATEAAGVADDLKMYAVGFLEGFTTTRQIRDFQHNANGLMAKDEQNHNALGNIRGLFSQEIDTIRTKGGMLGNGTVLLDANQPKDPWWRHAKYMFLQAWGILDAYNLHAEKVEGVPMSMVDLLILNSDGETPELEMAYDAQEVMLRESIRDGDDSDTSVDADSDANASKKAKAFLQKTSRSKRSRSMQPDGAEYVLAPEDRKQLLSRAKARRMQMLRQMDDKAWRKFKQRYGRCSALVRLAKNNSDLFVGHTTFSDYSEMNRIFKYYDLPLQGKGSRHMGFSSYPGVVGSTDDYYVMDTGLVVTETTVSMMSDEAFDKLDDNTSAKVPDYMRIMLSNRLATTAKEWVDYMTESATGTYNSQWMIVDYKLFEAGKALKNGTFYVLEQGPGASHSEDMTARLQHTGFWGSENRAFFADVRNISGETDAEEMNGNTYSAEENPRAHIFEKTAPEVSSLADMRHEMQRNRWPHEVDGGPDNTPDHAIAARGDLDAGFPRPNGAVDSKVTSACLAKLLVADAINGPSHDTQKPFRWVDEKGKSLFPDYPRAGLPDVWNFDWVRMTPTGGLGKLPADNCAMHE